MARTANTSPVVEPSCPLGYTQSDIRALLGDGEGLFMTWMNGQTFALCHGYYYDHDLEINLHSACAENPHGPVYYTWDVQRFINGRKIVD